MQFFGCKGAPEHAFPLYTIEDALRLRTHIVGRWEAADRDPSLVADGALNVVVVGGGPTGIESVGALTELYATAFAKDYPDTRPEDARLILVEAGRTSSRCSSPTSANTRSRSSRSEASRSCSANASKPSSRHA